MVDDAIQNVASVRGELGALDNRLTTTINNLSISVENLSAARSKIKDVDIASETALTQANILMQAGISVLAQANSAPQLALELLKVKKACKI